MLRTNAIAGQQKVDEAQLIAAGEWVGAGFEEETDHARRDESRQRE